jgi:hypothetical protein
MGMPATAMALVYGFIFPSTNFDVDNDKELMMALCIAYFLRI